jgi:NAD-dependent SIR2 family protein deacetylase
VQVFLPEAEYQPSGAMAVFWGSMKAEDLASPYGYKKNPEAVWRWYIEED